MRKPLKLGIIVGSAVVVAAVGQGCQSNHLDRRQHAKTGISAPTTSSAVSDVPATVIEQEKSAYDAGAKHASEAYDDVNKLATKAAGDLKNSAMQAESNLTQTAKKAVGTRAKEATDDLLNAIGPQDPGATKAADDPVALPDPSTGKP